MSQAIYFFERTKIDGAYTRQKNVLGSNSRTVGTSSSIAEQEVINSATQRNEKSSEYESTTFLTSLTKP
jgi:hypothetical protein